MTIESVLGKELEIERARSQKLEDEIIRISAILRRFDESHTYPDSINKSLKELHTFLNQHYQLKV